MEQRAKLTRTRRGQAVRLPVAFQFEGDEVFIRRDAMTGDVILSAKPTTWDSFFEALKGVEIPDDFLSSMERKQPPADRDPFRDWVE